MTLKLVTMLCVSGHGCIPKSYFESLLLCSSSSRDEIATSLDYSEDRGPQWIFPVSPDRRGGCYTVHLKLDRVWREFVDFPWHTLVLFWRPHVEDVCRVGLADVVGTGKSESTLSVPVHPPYLTLVSLQILPVVLLDTTVSSFRLLLTPTDSCVIVCVPFVVPRRPCLTRRNFWNYRLYRTLVSFKSTL